MLGKLYNIFFDPSIDIIATDNQPVANIGVLDKFNEKSKVNRNYFIDRSTGLGFRYDLSSYSKNRRRVVFMILLALALFYPLLLLRFFQVRNECEASDIFHAIIFYIPLCLGVIVIACFGLFCPLRAVTMIYRMEQGIFGKYGIACMAAVSFEGGVNLFSELHAIIAALRQRIVLSLLLVAALLIARFSAVFAWLKQQIIFSTVLGFGCQSVAIVGLHFVFCVTIFAAVLFLCGIVQSSELIDQHRLECRDILIKHILLHISLLGMVCCYLVVLVSSGMIIPDPVLLANVISAFSIAATSLLHYWHSSAEAEIGAKLILTGEYASAAIFKPESSLCSVTVANILSVSVSDCLYSYSSFKF